MSVQIHHPLIGDVRGVLKDEVAQFRGIKYGQLSNRLAESRVHEYESGRTLEAKEFGYVHLPDLPEIS